VDNIAKEIHGIKQSLDKQNEIVLDMLKVIQKPENKFTQVLQTLVLIIGVLGIANVIEIIRNWLFGG